MSHLGGVWAAALGAVSSVLINNLPAAALLSGQSPPHPLPLLIGLNLEPNLAFTGSLSAYLWYQPARRAGTEPSLRQSSLLGLALVPLMLVVALSALALAASWCLLNGDDMLPKPAEPGVLGRGDP